MTKHLTVSMEKLKRRFVYERTIEGIEKGVDTSDIDDLIKALEFNKTEETVYGIYKQGVCDGFYLGDIEAVTRIRPDMAQALMEKFMGNDVVEIIESEPDSV